VITAEDPRTENVEDISEEIAGWAKKTGASEVYETEFVDRKFRKLQTFIRIPDRQEAINFAVSIAKTGDVIGLFGKGHEKSMAFGKTEISWSEYRAVEIALDGIHRK
jgi:UDP-N-acetylmuramoyl-L-alanyl-D-glutamate--2,6-diaminopimelate ligase